DSAAVREGRQRGEGRRLTARGLCYRCGFAPLLCYLCGFAPLRRRGDAGGVGDTAARQRPYTVARTEGRVEEAWEFRDAGRLSSGCCPGGGDHRVLVSALHSRVRAFNPNFGEMRRFSS